MAESNILGNTIHIVSIVFFFIKLEVCENINLFDEHIVCIVLPKMLLSAIIIMVLQQVNIVDNCHGNK